MSDLLLGTSGWSYGEWVGPFYQKSRKMLSYYARFFRTVEINSTFYRYPSKATIYGLNRTSPADFIFSTKLPRLITHEKRLNPDLKVREDLGRFLELLKPLDAKGKLGCILIQLPPSFAYERDRENFEDFLGMIPEGHDFAVEFRNDSWLREDTWKTLEKHNVSYCAVDEPLLPPEVHVTADFACFKWHGRGTRPWYNYRYSEKELAEWVPRIDQVKGKVKRVYGYFNNHYHGYAVENCMDISRMLGIAKSEYSGVKERIVRHNTVRATGSAIALSGWASEALGGSIESLGTIPVSRQEKMGITRLVTEATTLEGQLKSLTLRMQRLEERLDQAERKKFEEVRRERELFIPDRVWEKIPAGVKGVVETVRKSYERGVPEVCTSHIRKALATAITIRFVMDDKNEELYDDQGEPYSLPKILEKAKQEGYISSYLFRQLRKEVKVFGDIGAHDWRIDFEEEDVIPLFKLLRLALESIYYKRE